MSHLYHLRRMLETHDVTIKVPSWQLAVALLIPTGGYLFRTLTRLPKPRNTIKTSHGLSEVPPSPLKTRIDEIYPEDALGKACYVDLPYGRTKYSISGPTDGRKVALIHGYSTPSITYKGVHDRLVAAGFRVLTYDIYGRGYSDAPHDVALPVYTTQLALLMQHIGWEKARIVGFSMGGAVAAGFATQFPNLVDSDVALLSSVGNYTDTHPFGGSYAFYSRPFFPWLKSLLPKSMKLPPPPKTPIEAIDQLGDLQRMTLPRYSQVLASTLQRGPIREMGPTFAKLGTMPFRTLLLQGTDDEIVTYHLYFEPTLTKYFPKAKVVVIEGAPHDLTVTHPKQVASALIEFFNGA
ncbi:alpha/beta-hydrolase [Clavulina sp. PMI_390]|nr:alpha/beta-hydrolase [Clavulina sp. PMI_390]